MTYQDLTKAYTEALNLNGYGFQFTVAKTIENLHARDQCPWYVSVVEFPVSIKGRDTRIDLILKHRTRNLYIVAECKRANPAYSDWVFAKASYVPPVQLAKSAFVEQVQWPKGGPKFTTSLEQLVHSERVHHVGLEIKSDKKGDRYGAVKDQIEHAATQACVALNGLVQLYVEQPAVFGNASLIRVLPVVFTTANLYSSPVQLSEADIHSGNLDPSQVELEPTPWLNLHYHQSPGLKHEVASGSDHQDLRESLYAEYVRTIPFVSPDGINSFLFSGLFWP